MSIFKRLFGIRKARKNTGDTKVDFEIIDLKKGFLLDYDMQNWEVTDVAIYTWDNGVKDYEYTIFNGVKKLYLNYETSNEKLSIYWDAKINEIWGQASRQMRMGTDLSNTLFDYNSVEYYYSGEGAAKVSNSKETYHMVNWLFANDVDDTLISFNKYDDNSTEAYIGKKLPSHAISNILPRK